MMQLPTWLAPVDGKPGVFNANPDGFYPALLAELARHKQLGINPTAPDQYALEMAYTVMRLDAQLFVSLSGLDPRPEKALVITVCNDGPGTKQRWRQADKPAGKYQALREQHGEKGAERAVQQEAKALYRSMRGVVPN